MDKIFSISETAEYLGVFPLTIRNWEKNGKIKPFRTLGGHRRFKKSDLDKIMGSSDIRLRLKESIEKLEEINFKNGCQEEVNKLIKDLENVAKEL